MLRLFDQFNLKTVCDWWRIYQALGEDFFDNNGGFAVMCADMNAFLGRMRSFDSFTSYLDFEEFDGLISLFKQCGFVHGASKLESSYFDCTVAKKQALNICNHYYEYIYYPEHSAGEIVDSNDPRLVVPDDVLSCYVPAGPGLSDQYNGRLIVDWWRTYQALGEDFFASQGGLYQIRENGTHFLDHASLFSAECDYYFFENEYGLLVDLFVSLGFFKGATAISDYCDAKDYGKAKKLCDIYNNYLSDPNLSAGEVVDVRDERLSAGMDRKCICY